MTDRDLMPGMTRVYFHRVPDTDVGRAEWEYRVDDISLLKYFFSPVPGDAGRIVFRNGMPEEVQESFSLAMKNQTHRWFTSDGWALDLPSCVVSAINECLDDILAEITEIELRIGQWSSSD